MQTLKKKQTQHRPLGIAVAIMTKNKGLFQKMWMDFNAEDISWIEVIEYYDPQGGRSLHYHDFSVSTKRKEEDKP